MILSAPAGHGVATSKPISATKAPRKTFLVCIVLLLKVLPQFFSTDKVDALFELLKDKAEVDYEPTNQFYGQRDFGISDPNGFQFVFGQSSTA